MNFWRNGEVKKWGFINLLIVAAAAIVTYILSKQNTKVAAVVCVAGFIQFGVNVFTTKRRYDRLAGISDKIDEILHGDEHLSFEQYREG